MKSNINNLYFGIKLFPLSYSSKDKLKELKTYNLFDFSRVKWSVAKYITMSKEERKSLLSDPLHFCFGDVHGRIEYEYGISPWLQNIENIKISVYELYVEPNKGLLMEMVNNVSVSSAKAYLRDERKKRKGIK